jgi:hypothetical protein
VWPLTVGIIVPGIINCAPGLFQFFVITLFINSHVVTPKKQLMRDDIVNVAGVILRGAILYTA